MPTIDGYPAAGPLTGGETLPVSLPNGAVKSLTLNDFIAYLSGNGVPVNPGDGGGTTPGTNHILAHDGVSRVLTRSGAFLTFR